MNFIIDFYNFLLIPNSEKALILSVPLTILKAYFVVLIFENLYQLNFQYKRIFLFIILDTIIDLILYTTFLLPYGHLFSIFTTLLLFIFIFNQPFIRSVIIQTISLGIVVISELLFSNLFCSFYNISTYSNSLYIPMYKISMLLCVCIISFVIYYIIDYKKITIIEIEKISKMNFSIFVSVIAILLVLTYQFFKSIYFNNSNLLAFDIIILALYLAITISSIINLTKIYHSNLQIKNLELYNKTLTLMQDNIRAFKHDFSNIMQAIGGYLMLNNFDDLKKYYSDLLKDCNCINNLDSLNPDLINNPAIFNILANKYYLSMQYNIKMNISVFLDMNSLNIKTYDLSRILGILLDNAIEAAKECTNKEIFISFYKDSKSNRNLITIENSYSDKNIDINQIFEKGFSSKKDNTGLGLWEVRNILNQNTNLNLFTNKTNELFKQQLEIYETI